MFTKLKNVTLKLVGKSFLYLFYVILVVFYLTLFQVPVPFIADTVANFLQHKYTTKMNMIDKLQVGGVSLAWNYEINRPIILITNISYISANNITKLSKIGFYPNIPVSLKEKELFIEKIYIEGLNVIIQQANKGNFSINLKNVTKVKQQKKAQASSSHSVLSNKNYNIENIYFYIKSVKNLAPVLKYLNEFSISKSKLSFKNQNQRSVLLNLNYLTFMDKKDIMIDIDSKLKFDSNSNRQAQMKGNLQLNAKGKVKSNLIIKDLYLEQVNYFVAGLFKNDFSKQLTIKNFKSDITLKSLYNLSTGFEDVRGELEAKAGSIKYPWFDKKLDISKIKMDIGYNLNSNDIFIDNFNVLFKAKSGLNLKELGIKIEPSQLLINAKINLKAKTISLYKSFIIANGFRMNLSANYNYHYLNNKILALSTSIKQVKFNSLIQLWPNKVNPATKNWLRKNIKLAKIDKINLDAVISFTPSAVKIKQVASKILLSDLQVVYISGLPMIQSNDVIFESDNANISFTFRNAKSELLQFSKGFIKIFDYSRKPKYQAGVYVNLELDTAKIPDVLNYINKDALNLLAKTKIKIEDISGNTSGNLNLLYALDSDKLRSLNANFMATNVVYKNIFQAQEMTNGELNITINKNALNLNGTASFLDNETDIDINYNWEADKTLSIYKFHTEKLEIAKIYQLKLIDDKLLDNFVGKADFLINYHDYDNKSNIKVEANLKQALWNFKEFDYQKPIGLPLHLNTNITLVNNTLSVINNLRLYNNNLNIIMQLSKNKDSTSINLSKLFINDKADGLVNILLKKNSTNVAIRGNFLDVTAIIDILKNLKAKAKKDEATKPNEAIKPNEDNESDEGNYVVVQQVDNNDNFVSQAIKNQTNIQHNSLVLSEANSKLNLKNEYQVNNTKLSQVVANELSVSDKNLESKTNTSKTSQQKVVSSKSAENSPQENSTKEKVINNYNIDIKLANMHSNGIKIKDVVANFIIIDGILDYVDFSYYLKNKRNYVFYNAKEQGALLEITDLGIFFKLFGIKSRIKHGFLKLKATIKKVFDEKTQKNIFISQGIASISNFSIYIALGFSSADINFEGKNYFFNLTDISLAGNFVGGNMSGYLDYENKILDVKGELIPIWSANHLISNAPLIKNLLGNGEGNNHSFLQIDMEIKGPLNDLKYFIFSKDKSSGKILKTLKNDDLLNEKNKATSSTDNKARDISNKDASNNNDTANNDSSNEDSSNYLKNSQEFKQKLQINDSWLKQSNNDSQIQNNLPAMNNLGNALDIGEIELGQYINLEQNQLSIIVKIPEFKNFNQVVKP